jgi:hypothetical protein
MKINSQTYKSDKQTLVKLFYFFISRLPSIYRHKDKTIPFVVAEVTLCNHRISREDARKLLKEFQQLGLLESVKFRGYRITPKACRAWLFGRDGK